MIMQLSSWPLECTVAPCIVLVPSSGRTHPIIPPVSKPILWCPYGRSGNGTVSSAFVSRWTTEALILKVRLLAAVTGNVFFSWISPPGPNIPVGGSRLIQKCDIKQAPSVYLPHCSWSWFRLNFKVDICLHIFSRPSEYVYLSAKTAGWLSLSLLSCVRAE